MYEGQYSGKQILSQQSQAGRSTGFDQNGSAENQFSYNMSQAGAPYYSQNMARQLEQRRPLQSLQPRQFESPPTLISQIAKMQQHQVLSQAALPQAAMPPLGPGGLGFAADRRHQDHDDRLREVFTEPMDMEYGSQLGYAGHAMQRAPLVDPRYQQHVVYPQYAYEGTVGGYPQCPQQAPHGPAASMLDNRYEPPPSYAGFNPTYTKSTPTRDEGRFDVDAHAAQPQQQAWARPAAPAAVAVKSFQQQKYQGQQDRPSASQRSGVVVGGPQRAFGPTTSSASAGMMPPVSRMTPSPSPSGSRMALPAPSPSPAPSTPSAPVAANMSGSSRSSFADASSAGSVAKKVAPTLERSLRILTGTVDNLHSWGRKLDEETRPLLLFEIFGSLDALTRGQWHASMMLSLRSLEGTATISAVYWEIDRPLPPVRMGSVVSCVCRMCPKWPSEQPPSRRMPRMQVLRMNVLGAAEVQHMKRLAFISNHAVQQGALVTPPPTTETTTETSRPSHGGPVTPNLKQTLISSYAAATTRPAASVSRQ